MRLNGGLNSREGRVEYCSGGVWGTVCDNTWDANDAGVVCYQLGYPSVGMPLECSHTYVQLHAHCFLDATPLYNAYFGQGAGPVTINTIVCSGNEPSISNCIVNTTSSCTHSNDASVRCAGQKNSSSLYLK